MRSTDIRTIRFNDSTYFCLNDVIDSTEQFFEDNEFHAITDCLMKANVQRVVSVNDILFFHDNFLSLAMSFSDK